MSTKTTQKRSGTRTTRSAAKTRRRANKSYERVFEEISRLAEAAKNGELAARANLDAFDGAERQLLENINEMLDAVINPLNVTAEYVDRISKGDIPEKITDGYKRCGGFWWGRCFR